MTSLSHSEFGNDVNLRLIDENAGSYKFYQISIHDRSADLFNNVTVTIKRGRIGENGEIIIRKFEDSQKGYAYLNRKVREKIKKGYAIFSGEAANRLRECQLCRLLERREKDACFIAEFERTMFFLNWDQSYSGRSMLILKTHVSNFFSMSTSEILAVVKEVRIAERALDEVLHPAMFNYLFMGNRAGHVHLHLVPRYSDDPQFGSSPFLDTANAISPQLDDLLYRTLAKKVAASIQVVTN